MHLTFRPASLDDFEAFYACCYSTFGYSDFLKAEVKGEWETFRRNTNALSVVAEDLDRNVEDRVVGYGEAVFITDAFAETAKSGKRPFLNKQIAEMVRDGSSPFLDKTQIRLAHFGAGITLFIAYIGWREQVLSPENARKVRDYLNDKLNNLGLGYYYKEVVIEVAGAMPRNRGLEAGFHLRSDYGPYYERLQTVGVSAPAPEFRPYLLGLTRAEAFQRDGTFLSRSFVYSKPRFAFREGQQELLCWAVQGRSDDEIASLVHVSSEAIKPRWNRIYAHIDEILPSLLPARGEGKRGPEKRSLLLAYLRDHPEELRPCIIPLRGYSLPLE